LKHRMNGVVIADDSDQILFANAVFEEMTGTPRDGIIGIKVEDDQSIVETQKKSGRVVATAKTTVPPDGTTATIPLRRQR
jgi:PAS domain-containing protein